MHYGTMNIMYPFSKHWSTISYSLVLRKFCNKLLQHHVFCRIYPLPKIFQSLLPFNIHPRPSTHAQSYFFHMSMHEKGVGQMTLAHGSLDGQSMFRLRWMVA